MKKFKPPRYTAKFLNSSFTDNNYFLRAVHLSLKYKCDSSKEGEDYPVTKIVLRKDGTGRSRTAISASYY